MKIQIKTPYDMHDKDIISYQNSFESLIVSVGQRNLNNKDLVLMKFIFSDVMGIKDMPSLGVSSFSEETEINDFMNEVLKHNYEKIPEKLPYKRYVFYDIDDNPCMEIIAEDVKIKKNKWRSFFH